MDHEQEQEAIESNEKRKAILWVLMHKVGCYSDKKAAYLNKIEDERVLGLLILYI